MHALWRGGGALVLGLVLALPGWGEAAGNKQRGKGKQNAQAGQQGQQPVGQQGQQPVAQPNPQPAGGLDQNLEQLIDQVMGQIVQANQQGMPVRDLERAMRGLVRAFMTLEGMGQGGGFGGGLADAGGGHHHRHRHRHRHKGVDNSDQSGMDTTGQSGMDMSGLAGMNMVGNLAGLNPRQRGNMGNTSTQPTTSNANGQGGFAAGMAGACGGQQQGSQTMTGAMVGSKTGGAGAQLWKKALALLGNQGGQALNGQGIAGTSQTSKPSVIGAAGTGGALTGQRRGGGKAVATTGKHMGSQAVARTGKAGAQTAQKARSGGHSGNLLSHVWHHVSNFTRSSGRMGGQPAHAGTHASSAARPAGGGGGHARASRSGRR